MQVADRFHLHQKLSESVKKALNQELLLPATISIPHSDKSTVLEQSFKKMESNVGKYSNSTIKSLKSFADGLKRDIETVAYEFLCEFILFSRYALK